MITKGNIDPGLVPIVHSVEYQATPYSEQLCVTDRYGRVLVIDFDTAYIWQHQTNNSTTSAPLQPFCYEDMFFPLPNKRPPLKDFVEDVVNEWLLASLHDVTPDIYLEAFDKAQPPLHNSIKNPLTYYHHEPIEEWPVTLDAVLDLVHEPVYP